MNRCIIQKFEKILVTKNRLHTNFPLQFMKTVNKQGNEQLKNTLSMTCESMKASEYSIHVA